VPSSGEAYSNSALAGWQLYAWSGLARSVETLRIIRASGILCEEQRDMGASTKWDTQNDAQQQCYYFHGGAAEGKRA